MIDHEFYCSSYASKEQPHIENLLHTLADGVRGLDREIAEHGAKGELMDPLEKKTKRLLHRLMSSTNRRMHNGVLEMLSYLLKEPSLYCSHSFATLPFHPVLQQVEKRLTHRM